MEWLIVGLGNPGPEYAHTRHNAGFMVIDELARRLGSSYTKEEGGALTQKQQIAREEVLLVKPQAFMNRSGSAVAHLAKAYKIPADHIIIVHDDMDITPGTIRLKLGGGSAGHNGLKSITEKLATNEYVRVRVGIGKAPGRRSGADFVLAPLRGKAREELDAGVELAADACECIIESGLSTAMNRFN